MMLEFAYDNRTNYDSITKYNGHEMEIHGEFG